MAKLIVVERDAMCIIAISFWSYILFHPAKELLSTYILLASHFQILSTPSSGESC